MKNSTPNTHTLHVCTKYGEIRTRRPKRGAFRLAFIRLFALLSIAHAPFAPLCACVFGNENKPVPSESSSPAPTASAAPTPSLLPTASAAPTVAPSPTPNANSLRAKYLGILGYGSVSAAEVQQDGAKLYRFLIEDREEVFAVKNDSEFSIQNALMEGYEYELTVEKTLITEAKLIGEANPYHASPVSYTPGERTLKNMLAAAVQPLGTTLYVYGGGWNWQDDDAGLLSRSIGLSRTWREFFLSQDADYAYKDEASPETSFYPFFGWCEYYYAGLDCSGYLGWVFYNTFEKTDGAAGYVFKSTDIAKTLSEKYSFGSYYNGKLENDGTKLQSGDVVSFKGHAYLVLGRCEDGSIVILHSSPTPSRSGSKGGGAQLSAINPNGKGGGMALELIKRYTERYYPEWYARYENIAVSYSTYIDFDRSGSAGFFRWNIGKDGALSDPDGILDMSAAEILNELFGE